MFFFSIIKTTRAKNFCRRIYWNWPNRDQHQYHTEGKMEIIDRPHAEWIIVGWSEGEKKSRPNPGHESAEKNKKITYMVNHEYQRHFMYPVFPEMQTYRIVIIRGLRYLFYSRYPINTSSFQFIMIITAKIWNQSRAREGHTTTQMPARMQAPSRSAASVDDLGFCLSLPGIISNCISILLLLLQPGW